MKNISKYALLMALGTLCIPGLATPDRQQVKNFIQQHGDLIQQLKPGVRGRVLNTQFDLLVIDDQVSHNQYLTTLNTKAPILSGDHPPMMFGSRHMGQGNKRLATWYPHAADNAIESMTAVQPEHAFRGLSDRHGHMIGGSRKVTLPNGEYVNPVLSKTAFDFLNNGAMGVEKRITVAEKMKSGRRRLVTAKVKKRAALRITLPATKGCIDDTVKGQSGKVCLIRQTEGTAMGMRAPDLRFSVQGSLNSGQGFFRVGNHDWHKLNDPVMLTEFNGKQDIAVFIPQASKPVLAMAKLKLNFFAPGRLNYGDSYVSAAILGAALPGEHQNVLSQTQFAWIQDKVKGDEYILSQSDRILNRAPLLPPSVSGHKGPASSEPARWELSDTVATVDKGTVAPKALFTGSGASTLFSPQAWQWFKQAKPGESKLLRYSDSETTVNTELKNASKLTLSKTLPHCHPQMVNGQGGTVCSLRRIESALKGDTSGIYFNFIRPMRKMYYQVGDEWTAINKSISLSAFDTAKKLDVFYPGNTKAEDAISTMKFVFSKSKDVNDEKLTGNVSSAPILTFTGDDNYHYSYPTYYVAAGLCPVKGDELSAFRSAGQSATNESGHYSGYDKDPIVYWEHDIQSGSVICPASVVLPATQGNLHEVPANGSKYLCAAQYQTGWTKNSASTILDEDVTCIPLTHSDPDLDIVSVSAPTVAEGGNLVYTVTLNQAATTADAQKIGLKLPMTTGTGYAVAADIDSTKVVLSGATSGSGATTIDLSSASSVYKVNVAAGKSSFTVSVPTKTDSLVEGDEKLDLQSSSDATSNTKTGTGTITDVAVPLDPLDIKSVSAPTATEGSNLVYTVTLNRAATAADAQQVGLKLPMNTGTGYAVAADIDSAQVVLTDATDNSGHTTVSLASSASYLNVNVAAGKSSFKVSVPTKTDSLNEGSEKLILDVYSFSTLNIKSGTGTITDPSIPLDIVSVSAPTATEGSNLVYTVTLSHTVTASDLTPYVSLTLPMTAGTGHASSADVDVTKVTLTNATDLTGKTSIDLSSNNFVNVAVGQSSFKVSVPTIKDSEAEGNETLELQAASADYVYKNTKTGTGTIMDSVVPLDIVSVSAPTAAEGSNLVYTVTLNRAATTADAQQVGLKLPMTAGTGYAVAADIDSTKVVLADATSTSGATTIDLSSASSVSKVNVAAGKSSFTVSVPTKTDSLVEGSEKLDLQSSSDATSNTKTGTGTITDVVVPLDVVSVSAPTAAEGSNLIYTVTLNRAVTAADASTREVGLELPMPTGTGYAVAEDIDRSKVVLTDAASTSGATTIDLTSHQYFYEVVVTPGKSSFTVSVPTKTDSLVEGSEKLELHSNSYTTSTVKIGTGTITDEVVPLDVVSVSAPTAAEGNNLVYTVTLNRAVTAEDTRQVGLELPMPTGTGYAVAEDIDRSKVVLTDAASTSGATTIDLTSHKYFYELVVTPGKSSFTVSVPTKTDSLVEGSEKLELHSNSYATSTVKIGTGTITDVVVPLDVVSVSAPTAAEGSNLVYTVTLNRAVTAEDTRQVGLELPMPTGTGYAVAEDIDRSKVVLTDAASTSGATTIDLTSHKYFYELVVTPGKSSFTVSVPTKTDSLVEGSEKLELHSNSYATSTVKIGTGTITDVVVPLDITSVSAPTAAEGSNLVYTVTLNRAATTADAQQVGLKLPMTAGTGYAVAADIDSTKVVLADATSDSGATTIDLSSASSVSKVNVAAGKSSFTVSVPTKTDSLVEGSEKLDLQSSSDATSNTKTGTGTITDVVVPLDITSVSAPTAAEGSNLVYTVTLNRAATTADAQQVGLKLPMTAGTGYAVAADIDSTKVVLADATSDSGATTIDLSSTSSVYKVNVAAGKSSFTVSVPTKTDSLLEGSEKLDLQSSSDATSNTKTGTGTITDTTVPLDIVSVSAPTAAEGSNLEYTVTLSRTVQASDETPYVKLTLPITAGDGHASSADVDATKVTLTNATDLYAGTTITDLSSFTYVVVAAGQSSFKVSVPTKTDSEAEGNETLDLQAASVDYIYQNTKTGTGTITDIEAPLDIVSVSAPTAAEGSNLVYTVTLNRAATAADSQGVTVNLPMPAGEGNASSADVDATVVQLTDAKDGAGGNSNVINLSFTTLDYPVIVTPGKSSFTVSVPTKTDSLVEGDEKLALKVGSTATQNTITGTGTITDIAAPLDIVSVSAPTAAEGSNLVYTVTLNRAATAADTQGVTVNLPMPAGEGNASSADVDATVVELTDAKDGAGGNSNVINLSFTTLDYPVIVTPGKSSFTVSVPTKTDSLVEGDEKLALKVGSAATQNTITGTGTITDVVSQVFSVTPVNSIQFDYTNEAGFVDQVVAFELNISSLASNPAYKLQAKRGTDYQLKPTGAQDGRTIDVDLLLATDKTALTPDTWVDLSDSYPGLFTLNTNTDEVQTVTSGFIAHLTNFFDGKSQVPAAYMPDGQYKGTVSADIRVLWQGSSVEKKVRSRDRKSRNH
ncbi:beta strand repeat-containing protein [Scandinavium lactucae]|uniref:beta strand repeat-containing protein n=1 Tax=Scandinavium lactucae TaxID=3095028 RepID=UPI0029C379D3|nr:hypothetical protein [Scandinavium sp. V105_1]MDX6051429.1 hypothetical protein [Scandinavium sp. V105_1]